MLTLTPTTRTVLLCRPFSNSQKKRVRLEGLVALGPFEFGVHQPLDGQAGVVMTELSTGTAVAFGQTNETALSQLASRLERESVMTFIARCQLAVDYNKQNTKVLIENVLYENTH